MTHADPPAPAPAARDAAHWQAQALASLQAGCSPAALALCRRAAAAGGERTTAVLARQLATLGRADEALALWADAGLPRGDNRARTDWLRHLHAAGQPARAVDETLAWFAARWPFDTLGAPARRAVVSAAPLLLQAGEAAGLHAAPPADWLRRHAGPPTQLAGWARAMVLAACMDHDAALAELEAACALPGACDELDLQAEIAALHLRHHDFGAARAALGPRPAEPRFALLARVEAVCGGKAGLYPECLLDRIVDDLRDAGPLGYAPEPGHVASVLGGLGQGGSERQTVNVVHALARAPQVRRQTVLVRWIEGRYGFFWPALDAVPAEKIVYGDAWRTATDLAQALPELAARPRLREAIGALPGTWREEIARLLRLLLDKRPAVVHIWQDMPAAALACAIAGVPVFFIHRGSLARNTWAHTPLRAQTELRPLRHAYRLLLAHTPFFFVNNSEPGAASDQAWLGDAWAGRFHVLHNVVEFGALGPDDGPNLALRAQLGIPATAPVVGGVFRLVAVKRPLLWIEAARQLLARHPDAHFVIVGEHREFAQPLQAFAAAHGFADRLHLPGAVSAVGAWYRIFDVLLLTSEREGRPYVCVEAQHFGVPVVSADVGDAASTLHHGVTGFLVPADAGATAFADALHRCLGDAAWRDGIGARARAFAHDGFGSAATLRGLLRLYGLDAGEVPPAGA